MTLNEQHSIGSGFTATTTAEEVLAGVGLAGRTALVTGASSGLGLETARALAGAGASVIAPVRDAHAAETAFAGTGGVQVVGGFDLGDLASVAAAADAIARRAGGIDILIAAAGVMATPQRPAGPGWDRQLAVNHFGHFALITRLYPLLAARQARVVVYSSAGHHASDIQWNDMHFLQGGYNKWAAYGQSKTANILCAAQLDLLGRPDGVRAFSLHPGKIFTGLQRDLSVEEMQGLGWVDESGAVVVPDLKTPSQGAATGLWAATSPALTGMGGLYLEDCEVAPVAEPDGRMDDGGVQPYALDPSSAARLWELTSAITATDIGAGFPAQG